MFRYLIYLGLFVVIVKCIQNKIIIRFDTLFRRGFRKFSDKYGVVCFVR